MMQSIAFLVFPGFQTIGLAAATVFEMANYVSEADLYRTDILSMSGGTVRSSDAIAVDSLPAAGRHVDTLIVLGGTGIPQVQAELIDYLKGVYVTTRRIASICTGAFILAEAGLLTGRRATTHWAFSATLRDRYPSIRLEEDRIFLIDGSIWTSAGMSAGVDLALAMVEKDTGRDTARAVAQTLVLYHRRAGGQSQHSTMLALEPKSDRVQTALSYAQQNLRNALSVEELADAAHLSPRQFSRVFRAETGESPAKAVERLRIEAARLMLEQGRHPIDVIARETGFDDRNRMRRAFVRAYGVSPQEIRRNISDEA